LPINHKNTSLFSYANFTSASEMYLHFQETRHTKKLPQHAIFLQIKEDV